MLDASFKSNDPRSYTILTFKHPQWNNCTVLELAYNAKNLDFIAHPCCQKILTKRLFGDIQIRDIDNGLVELPAWLKCLLSAFLFFPMYYWIVFPIHEQEKKKKAKKSRNPAHLNEAAAAVAAEENMPDDDVDEEELEAEETEAELNKKLLTELKKNRKNEPNLLFAKTYQKRMNTEFFTSKKLELSESDVQFQFSKNYEYVTPNFFQKVCVWRINTVI